MIINRPYFCTRLTIIAPRWHDRMVLVSVAKVHHASPIILIDFKTKSLVGQRFAITRSAAQEYPLTTNGKISCYAIPLDDLEGWSSGAEVLETVNQLFN